MVLDEGAVVVGAASEVVVVVLEIFLELGGS